jgi:hypothetical protein
MGQTKTLSLFLKGFVTSLFEEREGSFLFKSEDFTVFLKKKHFSFFFFFKKKCFQKKEIEKIVFSKNTLNPLRTKKTLIK